ncbi:proline-rich acidic protein 1 [Camelus ferus]|nr:proline-rich acidic protein 1 [Camelus ferus]
MPPGDKAQGLQHQDTCGRGGGGADSRVAGRLLLVIGLVAVLPWEAGSVLIPQVLLKTKGKVGMEQDTKEQHSLGLGPGCLPMPLTLGDFLGSAHEGAWGVRAMEPLEKDNQLMGLLVAPKVAAAPWEGEQGAKDILGPEPDRDSLYHSWLEEPQEEAGVRALVLPSHQVLEGPEEDRDHIYHPRES